MNRRILLMNFDIARVLIFKIAWHFFMRKKRFLKVCLLCVTNTFITFNIDISLEIYIITNNTIPFIPCL